jgi:hypothetical protein
MIEGTQGIIAQIPVHIMENVDSPNAMAREEVIGYAHWDTTTESITFDQDVESRVDTTGDYTPVGGVEYMNSRDTPNGTPPDFVLFDEKYLKDAAQQE